MPPRRFAAFAGRAKLVREATSAHALDDDVPDVELDRVGRNLRETAALAVRVRARPVRSQAGIAAIAVVDGAGERAAAVAARREPTERKRIVLRRPPRP